MLFRSATEWLHQEVRKNYWSYASSEELTIPALFAAKYSGIRATVGSSMIPDSAININLHNMLQTDEIYISVDNKGMTTPTASIAGFFFAHPAAKQFAIG